MEGAETSAGDVSIRDELRGAADNLQATVYELFGTHVEMTTLDMRALTGMNESATTFYQGLSERMEGVSRAAQEGCAHADTARRVAGDMERVVKAARRLEALVERLDEYTEQLERRLRPTRPTRSSQH